MMHCSERVCRVVAAPAFLAEVGHRVCRIGIGFLVATFFGIAPEVLAQSLTFEPESLELGTYLIGSDKPLRGKLTITNHSGETLRLRNANVSCGCVRVTESFDAIDAGASQSIVVEVRPESGPERENIKILSLRLQGEQIHQETIKIHWSEVHTIVAEPDKLAFTAMDAGEQRTALVKLQIADPKENERLNIKNVHASYSFVETKVIGDAQIQLRVRLPEAFEAARTAELVIDVESMHRAFPTLRLPLVVSRIPTPILASPSTIVLFQRPPREGRKVRVRLFDRGRDPLHVHSMRIDSGGGGGAGENDHSVSGDSVVELPPETAAHDRSRANIEVTIFPGKPGSRQTLIIQFKDSSATRLEIPIHHAYQL